MDKHDGVLGKIVMTVRPAVWCYVWAVLVGILVWAAAAPLLNLTEPLLLTAAGRLRGITAESVRRGLDLFIWAVRLATLYSTLVYCWQAWFCRLVVHDNGVELVTGFFRQEILAVPSGKVRGVTVSRSLWGRWLDYGNIAVDFGGAGPLVCRHVPQPGPIASKITR